MNHPYPETLWLENIRKALITGGSEDINLKAPFAVFAQIGLIVKGTINQFALLEQMDAIAYAIVIGKDLKCRKVTLTDSSLLM